MSLAGILLYEVIACGLVWLVCRHALWQNKRQLAATAERALTALQAIADSDRVADGVGRPRAVAGLPDARQRGQARPD